VPLRTKVPEAEVLATYSKKTFTNILFSFFKYFGLADAFIFSINYANNAYCRFEQQHCYVFQKTYILAGFEPGSSVPEGDTMATVPRRRDHTYIFNM
jgi:hypothetical protein